MTNYDIQTHRFCVLSSTTHSNGLRVLGLKGLIHHHTAISKAYISPRKSLDNPYETTAKTKTNIFMGMHIRGYIGLLNNSLARNIKFWLCFAIGNSQSQTCSFLIQDVRTRTMTEAHLPRHHLPPSAKLWRAHYRIIVITLPFLTAGWNFYSERHDDWKNITEEYGEASNRVFICGITDKKKKTG